MKLAFRASCPHLKSGEKVEGATFSWSGPRTSGQYDTNYATNRPSSRYYYDGQMGFEDDYNPSGTVTKVTRNLLGARGIDRISITENSATTHGYPLYDGHGNCRAILTKNGTSYGTGNWRTYDVWGSVRSGSATGDPKSRYVASIGHVADDESSLTYMRARYYEPATGRFLTEDPVKDGWNWYAYCSGDPVNKSDFAGTFAALDIFAKTMDEVFKFVEGYLGIHIPSVGKMAIKIAACYYAVRKLWSYSNGMWMLADFSLAASGPIVTSSFPWLGGGLMAVSALLRLGSLALKFVALLTIANCLRDVYILATESNEALTCL